MNDAERRAAIRQPSSYWQHRPHREDAQLHLFMHIPKAGGVSFTAMLVAHFGGKFCEMNDLQGVDTSSGQGTDCDDWVAGRRSSIGSDRPPLLYRSIPFLQTAFDKPFDQCDVLVATHVDYSLKTAILSAQKAGRLARRFPCRCAASSHAAARY